MDDAWLIKGAGDRVLRLTRLAHGGRAGETISPVLTVREVCRRLRKSRRQVYRYVSMGRLTPCARILGQWLFAPGTVTPFVCRGVPGRLKPLFWDVPLSSLAIDRHRDFILARVLEFGDREAVRWVLRTYPRPLLTVFLRGRGADLLTRRAWHFWTSQVGVRGHRRAGSSWRRRGRHWGGLS